MDADWDNDDSVLVHNEWTRISTNFTNTGYREGITAGKEGALQEGFDTGFAKVGVPLGRRIGVLRGTLSAITSYLSSPSHGIRDETRHSALLEEAHVLSGFVADIRLKDIAPVDEEAVAHALEHSDERQTMSRGDVGKRVDLEQLELAVNSLMQKVGPGSG